MLQIIVLNGELQGTSLNLFEGFQIGKTEMCHLIFDDDSFENNNFIVECNSSGNFTLYSENKKALIASGEENSPRLDLFPGLIFSINEIGFSIQEGEAIDGVAEEKYGAAPKINMSQAYSQLDVTTGYNAKLNLCELNLSLRFVRGLWLNQVWSIPWFPMSLGKKSSILFFSDQTIPSDLDFLKFNTSDDSKKILLSSDIANFVSLNQTLLNSPEEVSHGDLIEFGQTAFYIDLK